MDEYIAKPNPDAQLVIYRSPPSPGSLEFIDGLLYQYQYSYTDSQYAWYLVPGQEKING